MVGDEGAKEWREGTPSRLAMPHPSRAQLDAMIATGEAFRGKLDVFEHNPGEGVVVVGGGEGSGEHLKDWADAGGRTQVSCGRFVVYWMMDIGFVRDNWVS